MRWSPVWHRSGWCGPCVALCVVLGCAGAKGSVTPSSPTTGGGTAPARDERREPTVVPLEGMRLRSLGSGALRITEAYDSESLFRRATDEVRRRHCVEARALYDRLIAEFPRADAVSNAMYNRAHCYQQVGEQRTALKLFEALLRDDRARVVDVRDARFQVAFLGVQLEEWNRALVAAKGLLEDPSLDMDEKMEAMSQYARITLNLGKVEEAERYGHLAVHYSREGAGTPFFAGQAQFVVAEVFRIKSEEIQVPKGTVEEQHRALERRAQWLLRAQRAYFAAIRSKDARWASASGFRIGALYEDFWEAIMSAPVAEPQISMNREEREVYNAEYRAALAKRVRPLMKHAVTYWNLTLRMVRRTGVSSKWNEAIMTAMERVKARMGE